MLSPSSRYAVSMRWWMASSKWVLALVLLILAVPAPSLLQARVLRVQMTALQTAAGRAEGVAATLDWPDGAAQGVLNLTLDSLDLPELVFSARHVQWQCPLQREYSDAATAPTWRCDGQVRIAGQAAYPLSLSIAASGGIDVDLRVGKTRLAASTRTEAPDLTRIRLEHMPAIWLQALSQSIWADGRWRDGQFGGDLQLRTSPDTTALTGTLDFTGLALETPDGLIASDGLAGSLTADFKTQADNTRASLSLTLRGGEWLAGSLYAQLPDSPVQLTLQAEQRGDGPWRLPKLAMTDGKVLTLQGSAALARELALDDLDLQLTLGDLAIARDRYLSGFLAPAGFPDLLLAGAVEAAVTLRAGHPQALRLRLADVNAVDPRQRFVLSGLAGTLDWSASDPPQASGMRWRNAALYGIGIGAGRFDLNSTQGVVSLSRAVTVPVLKGQVVLESLQWQPPGAGHGTRFQLGVSMRDLDMSSLCQRLGWPPFTGTLGGRIPSARFEDGVLQLDGGLVMQLFGGQISLTDLVLERPFGVAPSLSAGVRIADLDLEPLTEAFGFGSITGRLDGRIDNARLVDWTPVAFDARLDTDANWKGKRRISQRAVQDISSIGGSGLMGGLQAQALRLFSDFGYARIGLGCRLRDNICRMDGVSSAGDGYTIVEGAGLPRIQVVGFRRQVDWPTLVARLKAVTEGQRPTFN